MTKAEMRTLRFQLFLTAVLFSVSVGIGIGIVCCRGYFERWLFEKHVAKYDSLPKQLQDAVDDLRTGDAMAEALGKLSAGDHEQIYQCCLAEDADARSKMARAVCQTNAAFYVARAERTVVVGSDEQRLRAVEFLESSQCSRAWRTALELSQWARRRQRPDLWRRLESAKKSLKSFAKDEETSQHSSFRSEPPAKTNDT